MKHHFSFLTITLILAVLILGSAAFQAENTGPSTGAGPRFPNAQDLVSRNGSANFVPKKRFVPIYKVPAGKWFVLTDLHIEREGGSMIYPKLVQRKDGKDLERIHWLFLRRNTRKGYATGTAPLGNPRTGLAFPPKVLVMLSAGRAMSGTAKYAYHMRGYLTDR